MKVVLLGAGGMLARDLLANAPAEHTVLPFTHEQLDVRDSVGLARALHENRPDWVMNASGITDVDRAEREPELAFAVNATAVGELATLCKENRCGFVHFSTDFIFDGSKTDCYREDDVPNPINTYGASKWEGEQIVRRNAGQHLIIRTQWLFGAGGTGFLSTLWQRARDRLPTCVVDDQFGCCTYSVDLARVTWAGLGRLAGTYHVANRGRVSRFHIARRIFEMAGTTELVSPCQSAALSLAAQRPASSQLCLDKVERDLGYRMPDWMDAIARYLSSVNQLPMPAVGRAT